MNPRPHILKPGFALAAALLLSPLMTSVAADKPSSHTIQNLDGWTVRVDDRLLNGEHAAEGGRALKLLESRLVAVSFVVPEPARAKLRAIQIQLDLNHGKLVPMQYHPGADWLRDNGYSEQLEKCVHIPSVADFLEPQCIQNQPWVLLHELAHGYHDQVIGFDDPRVIAAYEKFRDGGKYTSTLTVFGRDIEHYGLTDEKEFFAELTESYFGSNDFYPFVAGELQRAEPDIFALLADIWGPLPGFPPPKADTGK